MKLSLWAGALALALIAGAPAYPQVLTGHASSENGIGPVAPCASTDISGRPVLCSLANPLPTTAGPLATATSTPLSWSVSATTTVGPFAPVLGRSVWITKATNDTASLAVTATTDGNCAHGLPLTAANGKVRYVGASNFSRAHDIAGTGPHFEEERLFRIVDALDEIAAETGKTIPQIALAWVLSRPTISSVIIGARNEEQLIENVGAIGWTLTSDRIAMLDQASDAPAAYPSWHQTGFPYLNDKPPVHPASFGASL